MTTPTGTLVPESRLAAVDAHTGFTMAQANPYRTASSHRFSTCSRVASGLSRVWSMMPASACQLDRVLAVNAAASKLPLSNSRSLA